MQTVEEFSAFLQSKTKQTFCALISLSSLGLLDVQPHTETTDIKIHHATRTSVAYAEPIKGYNLHQYKKCDN